MNLSHSVRKGMLHTVKDMLCKLEDACQALYNSIEYHQEHIKKAQELLIGLEQEYINCKELVKEIEGKIASS